jgi:hypothetical protein
MACLLAGGLGLRTWLTNLIDANKNLWSVFDFVCAARSEAAIRCHSPIIDVA